VPELRANGSRGSLCRREAFDETLVDSFVPENFDGNELRRVCSLGLMNLMIPSRIAGAHAHT
jgi:hypothetical protein